MGFRPTIDMGLSPVFRTPTVMAIRVSGDSARRRYEETLGNLDRAVPQRLIAGITLPTTRTALREFDCSMKVNVSEGQSADRLNVHSAQLVGWQDVLRSEVNMVNIVNLSSPLSVVVCLVSLGGGSCSQRWTPSAGQLIDVAKWNLLRYIPVKMRGAEDDKEETAKPFASL